MAGLPTIVTDASREVKNWIDVIFANNEILPTAVPLAA